MINRTAIQFDTERLSIREFTANDGGFILELVNTPGWLEFIGNRGVSTVEEAQIYLITGPMNHYLQWNYGLYRVALKAGDTAIGMCGLIRRENLEHPDLGFAFLPQFTQNAYAFEAAMAILEFAQKQLHLKCIDAITMPSNKAAIRLLEKLKFVYLKDQQLTENAEPLRLYRFHAHK